ncbi:hypothetical protein PHMEG_0006609, partial [Phytophthora megakarya]
YRCDCKAFWNTGWLCSHVLDVMTLSDQFQLAQAVSILSTTNASGDQRKRQDAQNPDSPTSETFANGYLVPKPLVNPLHGIW